MTNDGTPLFEGDDNDAIEHPDAQASYDRETMYRDWAFDLHRRLEAEENHHRPKEGPWVY